MFIWERKKRIPNYMIIIYLNNRWNNGFQLVYFSNVKKMFVTLFSQFINWQNTKGSLLQIHFHQTLSQPIAFVYYDKYIQHSLSWQMLANPTILSCRKSLLIGKEEEEEEKNSISKLLFYHIMRSFQWRQKNEEIGISSQF